MDDLKRGAESSRSKRDPPGPDWTSKRVLESRRYVSHWISPVKSIEFTRHTSACEFQKLMRKYGSDEEQAWKAYRLKMRGKSTPVVSPQTYDAPENMLSTASPSDKRRVASIPSTKVIKRRADNIIAADKRQRLDARGANVSGCRNVSNGLRRDQICTTLSLSSRREAAKNKKPEQGSYYESNETCFICDDGGGR